MKLNLLFEGAREEFAIDLIRRTISGSPYNGRVWIAGGYVRDELLGRQPKDIDLVIDAPNGGIEFAIWLCKRLGIYKEGSNPVVYPRFGTAMFTLRKQSYHGHDLSGVEIECVMPRKDESATGGTRKDVVTVQGTMKDDAERRDLTINALYKNISTGEILDPTGRGVRDLKNEYLSTPGDPNRTYGAPPQGDPLRMLRAIRFHVKYGYELDPTVIKGIETNAAGLKDISFERIRDELTKMLESDRPADAMRMLVRTGLMKYIIPELSDLVGLEQGIHHNKGAFEHTMDVLGMVPPRITVRLGALLHDIGKPSTRQPHERNEYCFYDHDKVGFDIAKGILQRLKFPNDIINNASLLVRNHMGLRAARKSIPTDKALRKFARKCTSPENLQDSLMLMQADRRSHPGHENSNVFIDIKKRYDELKDMGENVSERQKLISGHDIMREFGLKEGPQIGAILDYVQELVDDDPTISREDAMLKLREKFDDTESSNIQRISPERDEQSGEGQERTPN